SVPAEPFPDPFRTTSANRLNDSGNATCNTTLSLSLLPLPGGGSTLLLPVGGLTMTSSGNSRRACPLDHLRSGPPWVIRFCRSASCCTVASIDAFSPPRPNARAPRYPTVANRFRSWDHRLPWPPSRRPTPNQKERPARTQTA